MTAAADSPLKTIIGLGSDPEPERDPGVEANARLTATTGLVLIVMLAAEGLTLASIRRLLPWHVAIGLALLPPVGLKLASTLWRFSRYYLADSRYRKAGPPHPLLRILGPFVAVTTIALFVSGVAAALAGPSSRSLVTIHIASFVLWFGVMTVHVVAHSWRAFRLARADLVTAAHQTRRVPYRRSRQGLVLASIGAGIVAAFAGQGMANGWTLWSHHLG